MGCARCRVRGKVEVYSAITTITDPSAPYFVQPSTLEHITSDASTEAHATGTKDVRKTGVFSRKSRSLFMVTLRRKRGFLGILIARKLFIATCPANTMARSILQCGRRELAQGDCHVVNGSACWGVGLPRGRHRGHSGHDGSFAPAASSDRPGGP
jgi:hypothetical protein